MHHYYPLFSPLVSFNNSLVLFVVIDCPIQLFDFLNIIFTLEKWFVHETHQKDFSTSLGAVWSPHELEVPHSIILWICKYINMQMNENMKIGDNNTFTSTFEQCALH